ncbi:MAG: uracil-DNA glycosylase [Dethiobacteria bacterium]|jgi:uracil-DNA glycosylase family 4
MEQISLLDYQYSSDFPLNMAGSVSTLENWRELCLQCRRCSLREGARGVVFGEGNPQADIMLIGEGPGGEEDKRGHPFVGTAGKLLDQILAACNLKREEVYIANIVKCRPPGNRTPQREEIEACYPLLQKQVQLVDPAIIICLGAIASKTIINPAFSITRERGRWHKLGNRLVMPTFHPAALLRDPKKKRPVWEDFKEIMAAYSKIKNSFTGSPGEEI